MDMVKRLIIVLIFVLLATAQAKAEIPATLGWYSIPNSNISANTICAYDAGYDVGGAGAVDCTGVTQAWSGGAFDSTRNRLLVWGGGHGDYNGNEIYALDLDDLTMARITNPGIPTASSCTAGIVSNTQPNARHTYGGVTYAANADVFFATGGSLSCASGASAANPLADFWTYSFAGSAWSNESIVNDSDPDEPGDLTPNNNFKWTAAYDPAKGQVFFHDCFYLYSFIPSTHHIARVSDRADCVSYQSAAVDIDRHYYVEIGGGRVNWWNISGTPNYAETQEQATTNCTSGIGGSAPGVAYDTVQRKIVIWPGGNTVYLLDTGTWTCTSVTYSSGPTAHDQGTYGRFAYSQASGVFVTCNATTVNCYSLRLVPQADADFDNRCRATGVVYCNGFNNTTADIVQGDNLYASCAGSGPYHGALDTTVKASGAGSLKFTLPSAGDCSASADITGKWSLEGVEGGWGQTFSENSTFYVQFRVRFSPEFNSNSNWDSAPKISILQMGSLSCGGIEITTVNKDLSEVWSLYRQCGGYIIGVAGNGGALGPGGPSPPYWIQNTDWPNCAYSDFDSDHCFVYPSDEWITLYYRIDIGTWDQANSRVRAYVATESDPAYRTLLDTGQVQVLTCNSDPCTQEPGKSQGFNNITLTNYMTALSVAGEQTAYSWYDELIVSTSPIAAPGQPPAEPEAAGYVRSIRNQGVY